MTIVDTTPYPASRLQFVGEETDLGAKFVSMSLWPDLLLARWQVGGGVPGQVAYWADAHTLTSNPDFVFTESTGQLAVNGQVSGTGILAQESTFVYWDGVTFAIGAPVMMDSAAPAPFLKVLSTYPFGTDAGVAMYQTSSVDGVLLAGVISIAAPAAYVDPASEYTEMYFLVKNPTGGFTEPFRATHTKVKINTGIDLQLGVPFVPGAVSATGTMVILDNTGTPRTVLCA